MSAKRLKEFLATLAALHFTLVSESVGQSVVVSTSVDLRLANLFLKCHVIISEPVRAGLCFFAGDVDGALGVETDLELGDNEGCSDAT